MNNSKKNILVEKARAKMVKTRYVSQEPQEQVPDGVFEIREDRKSYSPRINENDGITKESEKISFDSAESLADEIAAIRERK
ncbi:MAG: hypothetical protein E7A34_00015 [Leclercia adecarboxylata]|nr:hypothetical protein [Leclercia adecarboxylata]MDU1082758.1 hypothetical protein [Leclercia adecarboxylata]